MPGLRPVAELSLEQVSAGQDGDFRGQGGAFLHSEGGHRAAFASRRAECAVAII